MDSSQEWRESGFAIRSERNQMNAQACTRSRDHPALSGLQGIIRISHSDTRAGTFPTLRRCSALLAHIRLATAHAGMEVPHDSSREDSTAVVIAPELRSGRASPASHTNSLLRPPVMSAPSLDGLSQEAASDDLSSTSDTKDHEALELKSVEAGALATPIDAPGAGVLPAVQPSRAADNGRDPAQPSPSVPDVTASSLAPAGGRGLRLCVSDCTGRTADTIEKDVAEAPTPSPCVTPSTNGALLELLPAERLAVRGSRSDSVLPKEVQTLTAVPATNPVLAGRRRRSQRETAAFPNRKPGPCDRPEASKSKHPPFVLMTAQSCGFVPMRLRA
jgi:hypothetical protein